MDANGKIIPGRRRRRQDTYYGEPTVDPLTGKKIYPKREEDKSRNGGVSGSQNKGSEQLKGKKTFAPGATGSLEDEYYDEEDYDEESG